MSEELQKSQDDLREEMYAFVEGQVRGGVSKESISRMLAEKGFDSGEATLMVETIYSQVAKASEEEESSVTSVLPATIGGLLAAVVGGIVWGLVVIATEYEIGYLAWGIGLLCGFSVVKFAGGRKGIPLQVIAVLSSILGIVIGKYSAFFHFFKEAAIEEYGADVASEISVLSTDVIQLFFTEIGSIVSGYDLLWVALAVASAWKIPKGLKAQ